MMSFGESIKTCLFEKFFRISGRATRSEFWGGGTATSNISSFINQIIGELLANLPKLYEFCI